MKKTIILGSGGHAKVIIEMMRAARVYDPIGCLAPHVNVGSSILGVPILGDDEYLSELRHQGVRCAFVALGDNRLRFRLMQHVVNLGYVLARAVSPAAIVSKSARLGAGIAIMPGAQIGPETEIGDGVIINCRASVDHDGIIGRCAHVGPGATLAGCVTVGAQAFVATGASVIPGVTVGDGSIVGAGSVVIRDIPPHVVAFGCPARSRRALHENAPCNENTSQHESSVSVPLKQAS